MNKTYVPNPKAFQVEVGDIVHCRISKRAIKVAKKNEHGSVWEKMESNHPSLERNGGSLPNGYLRYIGTEYEEFQPAYVPVGESLTPVYTVPKFKAGDVLHLRFDYYHGVEKGAEVVCKQVRRDKNCGTGYRVTVEVKAPTKILKLDALWIKEYPVPKALTKAVRKLNRKTA